MLMSQIKSSVAVRGNSARWSLPMASVQEAAPEGTATGSFITSPPETPFVSSHLHLEVQQQKLLRKQQQTQQNNSWKDSWPLSPDPGAGQRLKVQPRCSSVKAKSLLLLSLSASPGVALLEKGLRIGLKNFR